MNRSRMLILAFFALLLSGVVTFLVYRELNSRFNPEVDESVEIVVARDRLPLGTRLEDMHLTTTPWPRGVKLEGSFANPEDVVGRGVVIPMLPNEPVLESKLAPREAGAGLMSAIPEGMRAVSVAVNAVIGVAGFIGPGTRVDVILTGSPSERGRRDTSKVILENIEVLAAGHNVERDAQGRPQNVQVITLLVTPDDAQKLALAQQDGAIQLAMRNPMDLDHVDPQAFRREALYGSASSYSPVPEEPTEEVPRRVVRVVQRAPEAPPPPPPPVTFTVELIQGSKRETSTFEERKPN
ncbi:MAG TPA: Flp pilus assembly protein CpaB [Acidobacteriota bacterium]|nr:Flp pilus assembly protein CpaB [Acidobacteriota bacterium]